MKRSLCALLPFFLAACSEDRPNGPPSAADEQAPLGPQHPGAPARPAQPQANNVAPTAKDDAPPPPASNVPMIGATGFQAVVLSDMEWPADGKKDGKVQRLGYIRHGGKAPVIPQAHKKANCPEGWYELVAGGFVCARYATTDLNHPKFRMAHAADTNAMLPYTYGVNNTHGTPAYRKVPTREERLKYEPWLSKPKTKAPPPEEENPYDTPDAGPSDDSKPWYLREADGGTPPQITLDELKEDGIAAKRLVKGFFVSLDKQFLDGKQTWWRLNDGLLLPADRVWIHKPPTEFHGVWLGDDSKGTFVTHPGGQARKILKLPVGFMTARTPRKYLVDPVKKKMSQGGLLHRFATVQLTGQVVQIGSTNYHETDEGWWMRESDGTVTEPGPPPEKLAPGEKWIDVNLARQTLVAFEGDRAVFATIISSGRQGHTTPAGSFRIREKHVSATMDGDAEAGASDGPYSIQDVPYIMYFSGGFALHGAFWHQDFGHVKSHGCVNLAPWDAKNLFGWADPQLPEGWHGVQASQNKPGSRVVLHN